MRYWLLLIPLLFTGCSSIRYVTVIHGHIYNQDRQPLNIVGNPPMVCHYEKDAMQNYYAGYFMYQDNDGTVLLDDFGRGTIYIKGTAELGNPICEIRLDNDLEVRKD